MRYFWPAFWFTVGMAIFVMAILVARADLLADPGCCEIDMCGLCG